MHIRVRVCMPLLVLCARRIVCYIIELGGTDVCMHVGVSSTQSGLPRYRHASFSHVCIHTWMCILCVHTYSLGFLALVCADAGEGINVYKVVL